MTGEPLARGVHLHHSAHAPLGVRGLAALLPQFSSLAHSATHNNRLDTNKQPAKTTSPAKTETTAPTKAASIAKKSTGHSMLLADLCTAATISRRTKFAPFFRRARLLRARRCLLVWRLPVLTPPAFGAY